MNPKNRDRFEQASKLLVRALELDPSYSQAYAALSMAYNLDYQNRWSDRPDASLRLAKQKAELAIEKIPTNHLRDLSRRGPQCLRTWIGRNPRLTTHWLLIQIPPGPTLFLVTLRPYRDGH